MTGRVFTAGKGGNPISPVLGTPSDLTGTAQPAIRQTPEVVPKSVIPFTDNGVPGYVDGAGNRIWHVDSSASAQAITFVSAGESTDFSYVVVWTNGANAVTINAASGNVGGTTTFTAIKVGDSYEFRSDGTDYRMVSRVGDFVASGGAAAFSNLTVSGSATFSGTVAFLTAANISGSLSVNTLTVAGTASFSGTVVMNTVQVLGTASFSGTVVMNSLTVLGSATFSSDVYVHGSLAVSATLSVGAAGITVGGVPLSSDVVKLGAVAITDVQVATISGSWTAYQAIEVTGFANVGLNANSLFAYVSTDNGTTRHLESLIASVSGTAGGQNLGFKVLAGGNGNVGPGKKTIQAISFQTNITALTDNQFLMSVTSNTGIINQIGIYVTASAGTTRTLSSGYMWAYGFK